MDWQAAAKLMATAISAIDQAVEMVRTSTSPSRAIDALQVIGAIVETVKSGNLDNLDPDKTRQDLDLLMTALGSNDDAADAEVADKFDTKQD